MKYDGILIFGPPGVGKGTHAKWLDQNSNLYHFSTGDMFRNLGGSEEGKNAKSYLDQGKLVPDEVTMQLFDRTLGDLIENGSFNPQEDYLLCDGIPRTVPQVKMLNERTGIEMVLHLQTSEETIVRRLDGRRVCGDCKTAYNILPECGPHPTTPGYCDDCETELYQREDDKPENVRKRFEEYENKTSPVIEQFSPEIVYGIDASEPNTARRSILEALSHLPDVTLPDSIED